MAVWLGTPGHLHLERASEANEYEILDSEEDVSLTKTSMWPLRCSSLLAQKMTNNKENTHPKRKYIRGSGETYIGLTYAPFLNPKIAKTIVLTANQKTAEYRRLRMRMTRPKPKTAMLEAPTRPLSRSALCFRHLAVRA